MQSHRIRLHQGYLTLMLMFGVSVPKVPDRDFHRHSELLLSFLQKQTSTLTAISD